MALRAFRAPPAHSGARRRPTRPISCNASKEEEAAEGDEREHVGGAASASSRPRVGRFACERSQLDGWSLTALGLVSAQVELRQQALRGDRQRAFERATAGAFVAPAAERCGHRGNVDRPLLRRLTRKSAVWLLAEEQCNFDAFDRQRVVDQSFAIFFAGFAAVASFRDLRASRPDCPHAASCSRPRPANASWRDGWRSKRCGQSAPDQHRSAPIPAPARMSARWCR